MVGPWGFTRYHNHMGSILFTISLLIAYVTSARVFSWPSESLWGFAVIFSATVFCILREAFPGHFGFLNARVNIIYSQQRMLKRKNFEIEKLKTALREAQQEIRGLHGLWMKINSSNTLPAAKPISQEFTQPQAVEVTMKQLIHQVAAVNSEFSDQERADIASKIIQKVLPVSNFKNYSIIENSIDRALDQPARRDYDFN